MREVKVTIGYTSEQIAQAIDDLQSLIKRDYQYITELGRSDLVDQYKAMKEYDSVDRALGIVRAVSASVAHAEDQISTDEQTTAADEAIVWHRFDWNDEETYPPGYREYLITITHNNGNNYVSIDEWQDYSGTYRPGEGWECHSVYDVAAWAELPKGYHTEKGGAE